MPVHGGFAGTAIPARRRISILAGARARRRRELSSGRSPFVGSRRRVLPRRGRSGTRSLLAGVRRRPPRQRSRRTRRRAHGALHVRRGRASLRGLRRACPPPAADCSARWVTDMKSLRSSRPPRHRRPAPDVELHRALDVNRLPPPRDADPPATHPPLARRPRLGVPARAPTRGRAAARGDLAPGRRAEPLDDPRLRHAALTPNVQMPFPERRPTCRKTTSTRDTGAASGAASRRQRGGADPPWVRGRRGRALPRGERRARRDFEGLPHEREFDITDTCPPRPGDEFHAVDPALVRRELRRGPGHMVDTPGISRDVYLCARRRSPTSTSCGHGRSPPHRRPGRGAAPARGPPPRSASTRGHAAALPLGRKTVAAPHRGRRRTPRSTPSRCAAGRETASCSVGFRTVEVEGGRLLVNGGRSRSTASTATTTTPDRGKAVTARTMGRRRGR